MGIKGLHTAVSGLKAQSEKMDVIANNLANVNTAGFKRDRVEFQDVYYQVMQHATQGDGATVGGTNPQEVGSGVQVSSITKIFSQGSQIATSRTLDFMVEGDDFFVAKSVGAGDIMLTRNGAFQLDGDMFLVDSMGNKIQGFNVDIETLAEDTVATNIQLDTEPIDPRATTNIELMRNIDSASVETAAQDSTNGWELFSKGETFGSMKTALTGLTGSIDTYGSGFYQDSYNYNDSSATVDATLSIVTLSSAPTNLIDGFAVGDTVTILQSGSQAQRTISAINTATREITLDSALSASFSSGSSLDIANLTDGTSILGTSGSSAVHTDLLSSQVAMVDDDGRLLASFYRVTGDASQYGRGSANVSGGGTITMGTGEFSNFRELKELIERTLRDTSLTYSATSNDLSVSIDKFGAMTFSGTGLVNEFRLVMNADNTEMLDRFNGIAMTDSGTTATTQARIDSNGDVITAPSLSLGARTTNVSKNWYSTSGIESYDYSDTNQATDYGEFAGLRLDGGTDGNGYGTLELSLTNALGNTVTRQFTMVSKDANASNLEFSNMGELSTLIQSALRTDTFSSIATDGTLSADLTATAEFTDGRLKVSTTNGSFRDLTINAFNTTADSNAGISRTDQDNFDTILGEIATGVNGKEGTSNGFIESDVRAHTLIYDSQGNEHTVVTYLVRDRSSGLSNIEWKYQHSLQPNINTFSENDPDSNTAYRNTFNSLVDSTTSRGVIGFDINTGNVLDGTSTGADARYDLTSTVAFVPQYNSVEADAMSVTIDFSDMTSYNGSNTVMGNNVDGYPIGNLMRIASSTNSGEIQGVYSNGNVRTLAKLGLMHIDNPEGLQKIGTNYFTQTTNANEGGTIKGIDSVFNTDSSAAAGNDSVNSTILSSALEASNVDIAEELTDMIVTQRSYSASGKVVTTTDDMIQEALSLKR